MMFCPRCKSNDISADLSAAAGFGITDMNRKACNKCGYTGTFFPET